MKRLRRWHKIVLILAILLAAGEITARYWLGLGYLPVYITNEKYEYIYAPDQDIWRFHNHIVTNEYSMRSKPLSKKDKCRILKFGDSVINGGPHVDHDSLASTLLENKLAEHFRDSIRVLNISAQSWGPDNAFSYLHEHGNFDSPFFILVFSSHDWHDNMHFKEVVGNHRAWPDSQPWCALTDGFSRYFIPKVKEWFGSEENEYEYLYGVNDSKINPGWNDFFNYCNQNQIALLIYLHPEQSELKNKKYDKNGTQLLNWIKKNKINHIEGISHPFKTTHYRDEIHLNESGHALLADVLYEEIELITDSIGKSKQLW